MHEVTQIDDVDNLIHPAPQLTGLAALDPQPGGDIVPYVEPGERQRLLKDEGNAISFRINAAPVDQDIPLGGRENSRKNIQQRRLAAS